MSLLLADSGSPLTSHSVFRNFSDYESKHSQQAIGADSPVRTRRHSWRQQIFLRVATPQKACDSPSRYDGKVCVYLLPLMLLVDVICEVWIILSTEWTYLPSAVFVLSLQFPTYFLVMPSSSAVEFIFFSYVCNIVLTVSN